LLGVVSLSVGLVVGVVLLVFGVGILLGFGFVVCIVVTGVFAVIVSVGVVLVAGGRGFGVSGLAWS
jgi:hypothetical protein